ncbi:MAG TPA: hypothetical protein DCP36_16005, partial [Sporomusaceae bacterium]|nr:hypothetical protein [Sporomusaceae bacterium]
MELKYLVLVMILLYVLPELFRRKPKKYEYPTIPEPVPNKTQQNVLKAEPLPAVKKQSASAPKISMPPEVHIPSVATEASPWQGQLTPANIQTGYIFAE